MLPDLYIFKLLLLQTFASFRWIKVIALLERERVWAEILRDFTNQNSYQRTLWIWKSTTVPFSTNSMEVCVSVYGILPPCTIPFQWRNSDWKLTMSHHQCVCCWHNKIHFLCEYHPLSLWCVPSISVNYLLISSKVFTDAILLPHKVV